LFSTAHRWRGFFNVFMLLAFPSSHVYFLLNFLRSFCVVMDVDNDDHDDDPYVYCVMHSVQTYDFPLSPPTDIYG